MDSPSVALKVPWAAMEVAPGGPGCHPQSNIVQGQSAVKLPLNHESREFEKPNLPHPAISKGRAVWAVSPSNLRFILNVMRVICPNGVPRKFCRVG